MELRLSVFLIKVVFLQFREMLDEELQTTFKPLLLPATLWDGRILAEKVPID